MTIGIGSGSTVLYFIEALGEKVRNGFNCKGVPTSLQTLSLARQHGIPMLELNEVEKIDIDIDGADEIDEQFCLIKGGGGALLQEKMVAAAARQVAIIADNAKLKSTLGTLPLPLEVIPYGWKKVQQQVHINWSVDSTLRMKDNQAFLTDHGHYILDCQFKNIPDPSLLNIALHLIPGVVEVGLFIDLCDIAIIGYPDGSVKRLTK